MPVYSFGSGTVWAFRTDVANPTPVKVFDLMESSIEISLSGKGLNANKVFSVAYGRGEGKVSGKLKFARQQARILSDLLLGVPLNKGQIDVVNGERLTIGASVTVANGADFLFDNGIINVATGQPFERVNAAPATGQYAVDVSTGEYSFAAADVTAAIPIIASYGFGIANVGQRITITNQDQGLQPAFQITMQDVYNSPLGIKKKTAVIYAAIGTKYSESGKSGDWKQPELEWEAIDNGSGVIADISLNENS